jgi:hypothetical protein
MSNMVQQLMLLGGAGGLIALFGIWHVLFTRLPKGAPGEKPLSKKEKAAIAEQERIEAAAKALLIKQGLISDEATPEVTPESPKLSRADQIKAKYGPK